MGRVRVGPVLVRGGGVRDGVGMAGGRGAGVCEALHQQVRRPWFSCSGDIMLTLRCSEQESLRLQESSHVDDRTEHEIYVHPFMRAVQAGVASVMCSYSA